MRLPFAFIAIVAYSISCGVCVQQELATQRIEEVGRVHSSAQLLIAALGGTRLSGWELKQHVRVTSHLREP
jgi:hypothetical protein